MGLGQRENKGRKEGRMEGGGRGRSVVLETGKACTAVIAICRFNGGRFVI